MRRASRGEARYGNFIGGEWVAPSTDAYAPDRNPANLDDVLGEFPVGGAKDAEAAVAAASAAFPRWAAMTGPSRARILWRAAELMRARQDELAVTICREEGKTISEAKAEVQDGILAFELYAGDGVRTRGETLPAGARHRLSFTLRQPLGVVAVITPWSFPFALPAWRAAPALATGNAVVLKPASNAPATATLLAELLDEAGLPKGAFNLVHGPGAAVGQAVADDPRVEAVSFTGSNPVAFSLAERCARRGTRVSAEPSAKNAAVVLDDAELERAAAGILSGAFGSTGQRCTATSRVIAERGIAGRLTEALVAGARKLKVGNGMEPGVEMGPAADEAQLQGDLAIVELGRQEGAVVLAGGARLSGGACDKGYFMEPTVLGRVRPGMRVHEEEVFGPVAAVVEAGDFDEAVEVVNAVEHGRSASIYTRDSGAAMRFVERARVASVFVNGAAAEGEAQLPSGELAEEGARFFTRVKVASLDASAPRAPRWSD